MESKSASTNLGTDNLRAGGPDDSRAGGPDDSRVQIEKTSAQDHQSDVTRSGSTDSRSDSK